MFPWAEHSEPAWILTQITLEYTLQVSENGDSINRFFFYPPLKQANHVFFFCFCLSVRLATVDSLRFPSEAQIKANSIANCNL